MEDIAKLILETDKEIVTIQNNINHQGNNNLKENLINSLYLLIEKKK